MAKKKSARFKVRTREHRIASESVAHVLGFVAAAGHTAEEVRADYGYDLILFTHAPRGATERGHVYFQLKATERVTVTPRGVSFRIDTRDYRQWVREPMPVFLIVYDAEKKLAYWLYVQHYFQADRTRRPRAGAKTLTVVIPANNVVDRAFMEYARGRKAELLDQIPDPLVHNA